MLVRVAARMNSTITTAMMIGTSELFARAVKPRTIWVLKPAPGTCPSVKWVN